MNKSLRVHTIKDDLADGILTQVTPASMFVYQGGRFIYSNPAFERLTGFSYHELTGMSFRNLFPETACKILRKKGLNLKEGADSDIRSELRLTQKCGLEYWVDLTISTVEYYGKPALVGTAVDISDQKRAELLQDATYRIVQAADKSKNLEDLFTAIHEIIGEVMTAKNIYIALTDRENSLIQYPYYVDEYDNPAKPHKPGKGLTEWILKHGKSLLVDENLQAQLEESGEVELIGTPSLIWLGVPLVLDEIVIGALVLQDYSDASVYGLQEQRMLEFVSTQVAMAIQRKRSEDALRESEERSRVRAGELAVLHETTRDIALQHNLEELLNTISERVISLIDSPVCTIYLYDQERGDLEAVASQGWPGIKGMRFQLGEGITGQSAVSQKPVVTDDYRLEKNQSKKFSNVPAKAVAAVPMIYNGQLVGVLTTFKVEVDEVEIEAKNIANKFTSSDVDLLTVFAATAAGAVHNAKLFKETRQRLVEIELLYQVSQAASQIHSVRAVAQHIIDALDNFMDWRGSIWIVVDNFPVLLAYSSRGLSDEEHNQEVKRVQGLIRTLDEGIVGWVLKHDVSYRSGDIEFDDKYISFSSEVVSVMCVPMESNGRAIGCINVESANKNAFSEHDERLLTTLANQANTAIENARLFDETRRRASRQSALNTIILIATRAGTDLEELLNTTLDQTLEAFRLDMGEIWLTSVQRGIKRVATRGLPTTLSLLMTNAAMTGNISLDSTILIGENDREYPTLADMLNGLGIKSAIVCPLMSDERRIGGLAITSAQNRKWSPDEISFVETIAGELGAAAERARLFSETRIRLLEFEAVNRVSAALRISQSMDAMLPELLDETLTTLDTDTGSIWLFNEERGFLQQAVGRGWCTRLTQIGFQPGEGILGTVFSTSDILFSPDIALDPITPAFARELIPPGWSSVCIPIRTEQQAIGVLEVVARLPREFDGENARLLVTLADMAGNTIHRVQLNEKTRRHAIELEERVASRTVELSDALSKAQEADRVKTEFIANINHELRTPLTNLILYYQMLRAQPTVKTQERLDVIGRELQRLRNLIEDLLNLSRLDQQRAYINPIPCDIAKIIRSLVEDRRSLAEERKLKLLIDFQSDLPVVLADEALMVQVISNLLTNALNYTPAGGTVQVRTMTEIKGRKEWIGFSVEDTGPGIDENEKEHLFERFYRGKAARSSGAPGTGLGLAIVKEVVDRHGGRIEVPIIKDGGAVFRIWLPSNEKETS